MQMPGIWLWSIFLRQGSGLGVVNALQARPKNQKLLVLSNYATPDVRERCQRLNADAIFDKSNEIDGLVDFCIDLNTNKV